MAGRKFVVAWHHSAEELFARYQAERDGRLVRRWQALWHLRRGKSLAEVAALVGVAYRTVQAWVGWYRAGGLAEVAGHARGGLRRPIVEPLTPEQQAALVQQARAEGFATVKQAIAWGQQQWGVTLSEDQMRRQFARLQLRAKLPRPISDRADPAAPAAWRKGGSPSG
ncbi:MAG TPA: helix-turn-helix domain-containing protein [Chloroflexota bacterium]|nr:helix-turn-helix domain-containing protein [Chloroflexota bacterium]